MNVTVPSSFYIDRRTTNVIKGVALIFMFVHHFFTFPEWLVDGIEYSWIDVFATYFNSAFKICVPIFAFMTGYFYCFSKNKTFRNSLKKASDLWVVYVLVFFVMLVPALYFGVYERSIVKFVAEVLSVYTPTMMFCWYVPFYIIVMLLFPFVSKGLEKNPFVTAALVVTVPVVLRYGNLILQNGPFVLLCDIIDNLSWISCIISGYLFARYKIFDKLYAFCQERRIAAYIGIQLLCMALPFFSRYYTTGFDIFYAPLFIFGLVNLVNILRHKWLGYCHRCILSVNIPCQCGFCTLYFLMRAANTPSGFCIIRKTRFWCCSGAC